ncbi:MAG TPA: Fe-S cluster assembly protein SufD [Caulobacteraceae bacterium]
MSVAAAIRGGDVSRLPSRRDEDWRWTDLRGLIRALPSPSPAEGEVTPGGPWGEIRSDEFLVVNGRHRYGPGWIRVAAGDHPTARLRWAATADAGAHVGQTRITVGRGASLVLLESHEGPAEGAYVASAELDIALDEGARLDRVILANEAADAVTVSHAAVRLAPGATFRQTVLASGAKRQRFETRLRHGGGGASVQLDGLYVLGDARHSDQTTEVVHETTDGTTSQLTKGVAIGRSRGVFQGRIVVAHGADRTDARMGHHALILSEQAEIDAKPELEIYADDVQCAHGNTIGALDEAALFYARTRGIPEDDARALLTEAFLGEVIDRISNEPAREVARAWVSERLRRLR